MVVGRVLIIFMVKLEKSTLSDVHVVHVVVQKINKEERCAYDTYIEQEYANYL